jgi:hypothetical protein
MRDGKEDSVGFVKTIKNKVHDWWLSYDRKLWSARIFVYGGLFLLVISVGAVTFAHFNLFHTDVTSARYMLSALVQSQAAIVAIVITLTLIAVQLTASAYSPRVIDIFKKNPDMWLLLGCYGFSIFYGFIVLKLVEGAEGEFVSQSVIGSLGWVSISFESYVSLAYWLGIFTFVVLFPYMWNIIGLLKQEKIINRLAIEITRDKILNSKEDPIQPIVDIIHGSIMKYDLETTRVGLKEITLRVAKIIDFDSEKEISERFCGHLFRISRLAISREDEESTAKVIGSFAYFAILIAEKSLDFAIRRAAWFLGEVGKKAAEKGLEFATLQAVRSLVAVKGVAAEKGLWPAMGQAVQFLGEVGEKAAEKGLEDVTWEAAWFLGEVGITDAEKKLESATHFDATRIAAKSLLKVGMAEEKGFEKATRMAANALRKLPLLSEEIFKEAIQNYESKLEEQDRDSFQKFKKLYEQELEKLRAEKNQNKKTESK